MDDYIKKQAAAHGHKNYELTLPADAAYIKMAWQTAGTIADALGFDAREAHDLKTAVTDTCGYIVKHSDKDAAGEIKISFEASDRRISVKFDYPCEE